MKYCPHKKKEKDEVEVNMSAHITMLNSKAEVMQKCLVLEILSEEGSTGHLKNFWRQCHQMQ